MQYAALNICRYILNYCDSKRYINNLKLQKLLYFIQANFLINKKCPCFIENIEAWDFGPVVPEAYFEYKAYGTASIYDKTPYCGFIEENDKNLINEVVDRFADYSAASLTDLTQHQTPWKQAYVPGSREIIINESIQSFFNELEQNKKQKTSHYTVYGYDKDNDIYEPYGSYNNIEGAMQRLTALAAAHKKKEIRTKNGEPLDWFEIFDAEIDKRIAIAVIETSNGSETHVKITATI